MIERVLILVALTTALAALWGIVRLWRGWTVRALRPAAPFAGLVPRGQPAVVAFSAPGCVECRSRQAPALKRLDAQLGSRVSIVTLSALEHADLAAQLNVLTVPTTVVVDAGGTVRAINDGFADEARLAAQIGALGAPKG